MIIIIDIVHQETWKIRNWKSRTSKRPNSSGLVSLIYTKFDLAPQSFYLQFKLLSSNE